MGEHCRRIDVTSQAWDMWLVWVHGICTLLQMRGHHHPFFQPVCLHATNKEGITWIVSAAVLPLSVSPSCIIGTRTGYLINQSPRNYSSPWLCKLYSLVGDWLADDWVFCIRLDIIICIYHVSEKRAKTLGLGNQISTILIRPRFRGDISNQREIFLFRPLWISRRKKE